MKRLVRIAVLGGVACAVAACGNSDDASTEAMPESVEVRADEALATVSEEPVEDADAAGPQQTTSEAQDSNGEGDTAETPADPAPEPEAAE